MARKPEDRAARYREKAEDAGKIRRPHRRPKPIAPCLRQRIKEALEGPLSIGH